MPIFEADLDLLHSINQLISCTNQYLFIVSPYIDIDKDTEKVLSDMNSDVVKTIIYRDSNGSQSKSGISTKSRKFFKSLPNIEFVSVKNLHAKLYINEDAALISSMNLTDSSRYNFEAGINVLREEDIDLYHNCFGYIMLILQSDNSDMNEERFQNIIPKFPFTLEIEGKDPRINGKVIPRQEYDKLEKNCNVKHGYCIRCETTKVDFHPLSPMCNSCFTVWNKYKNKEHVENVCHRCGMETQSLINEPFCNECFGVYSFEIEREWKKFRELK